jgi:hypothetical protein
MDYFLYRIYSFDYQDNLLEIIETDNWLYWLHDMLERHDIDRIEIDLFWMNYNDTEKLHFK